METVAWHRVRDGKQDAARIPPSAEARHQGQSRFVLPGSFNPMHRGHQGMVDWVKGRFACAVDFEISIENVDKPSLSDDEIARRLAQFSPLQVVWITRATTFVEKAALFKGATFLVGADTILRMGHPRYYPDRDLGVTRATEAIGAADCRFIVFGRNIDGDFRTLADLDLPPALANICVPVVEPSFREDVSSTELRGRTASGPILPP